jgi:hypothetical protein
MATSINEETAPGLQAFAWFTNQIKEAISMNITPSFVPLMQAFTTLLIVLW